MKDLSIIVPTYNEAKNLPVLINGISEAVNNLDYEIIIVDDNSNDETFDIIDDLKKNHDIVFIERINKRDLSTAVIIGLEHSRANIILVMDGDLSHPPEKIPQLIGPILNGKTDFVIGSRFLKESKIEGFSTLRKLNAFIARVLAFPLVRVSDPMTGFFAMRRNLINPEIKLNPIGFKICLELLVKANIENIHEVPILFQKRYHGLSKLNFKNQLKYLIHLKRLMAFKILKYFRSDCAARYLLHRKGIKG